MLPKSSSLRARHSLSGSFLSNRSFEIFPEALQPLVKLTPVYTVCYGPAKLIVDFSTEKYLEILLAQALYLGAAWGLMLFLYGKGAKKLYVNGG